MYQCSKKLVTCKEHCCFDHSDFPAHSMFTSDVCWGSLGTSIFGNSSSAASNTRSRLPSRLSFRFLWLWLKTFFITPERLWKSSHKVCAATFEHIFCVDNCVAASENNISCFLRNVRLLLKKNVQLIFFVFKQNVLVLLEIFHVFLRNVRLLLKRY